MHFTYKATAERSESADSRYVTLYGIRLSVYSTAEMALLVPAAAIVCHAETSKLEKMVDTQNAVRMLSVGTPVECKRTRRVPTQLMSKYQHTLVSALEQRRCKLKQLQQP